MLLESIKSQTDQDFEWIVADGNSTDGTVEYLRESGLKNLRLTISNDFGIYDALNRGIKESIASHYLVVGCDDRLYPNAIENIKAAIKDNESDVYCFDVIKDGAVSSLSRFPPRISGHKGLVSEHAVATIFRKELHDRIGLYSKKFPIAADHDFIVKCNMNNFKFTKINKVLGEYGTNGISSSDKLGSITESFRVQSQYFGVHFQILLLAIRISRFIIKG